MDGKNKLYFGDNPKILRDHVADASVDLFYLDPPFNSNATYNVLFKEKIGEESAVRLSSPPRACRGAAQFTAFEDTWEWGLEPEGIYKKIFTICTPLAVECRSVHDMLEAGLYAQKLAKSTCQTSRHEEHRR